MGALGGGHYVNTVRLGGSDEWFCLNDNSVTKVDRPVRDVGGNPSAYLLFYIRKDVKRYAATHSPDEIQDMVNNIYYYCY